VNSNTIYFFKCAIYETAETPIIPLWRHQSQSTITTAPMETHSMATRRDMINLYVFDRMNLTILKEIIGCLIAKHLKLFVTVKCGHTIWALLAVNSLIEYQVICEQILIMHAAYWTLTWMVQFLILVDSE